MIDEEIDKTIDRPAGQAEPVPRAPVRPAGAASVLATAHAPAAPAAPGRPRAIGVDAARGVALIGMMATHVFEVLHDDGTPTFIGSAAAGRSAAIFALVAGVSLAFITGGRQPVEGRSRAAARASIVVRALLIGAIGLLLGYTDAVDVILPYYAVLFLLAIPLIGLRPRVLAGLAAATAVVVPVLMMATDGFIPYSDSPDNPTFGFMLGDPLGFAGQLLLIGAYPALAWMTYICAGLAIGRLDLSSSRVAAALCGGGFALATGAWLASSTLLYPLGGLQHLAEAGPNGQDQAAAATAMAAGPDYPSWWDYESWWRLASHAPHSTTPLDLLYTLGAAMAILGLLLLLMRLDLAARLLGPLVAAGSMTLTLYTAHVLFQASGLLEDFSLVSYLFQVTAALAFAVAWRRTRGRGPLETLVAKAASHAQLTVALTGERPGRVPPAG